MNQEFYIKKYQKLKLAFGRTPKVREFYKEDGINKRAFEKCFGNNPYSKLQELSGDKLNRLELERTPTKQIFEQFGNIVEELNKLPTQVDWSYFECKPTVSGIEKPPHNIKWSNLPMLFYDYAEAENKWEKAREIIEKSHKIKIQPEKLDNDFQRCIDAIRKWTPLRKRFNEEGYKIELRNYLTENKIKIEEEIGDSNIDLLANNKIGIEIKKDPTTSEYDRLIGQIVKHLMKFDFLIVVIVNNSNYDRHQNFLNMIDFMCEGRSWNLEILSK